MDAHKIQMFARGHIIKKTWLRADAFIIIIHRCVKFTVATLAFVKALKRLLVHRSLNRQGIKIHIIIQINNGTLEAQTIRRV